MEIWDILDEDKRPTGRTHIRGDKLTNGDYHLVVDVLIRNSKGDYLIVKRAKGKTFENLWEIPGGSAVSGDDSYETAIKEVHEEIGMKLKSQGKLIKTLKRKDSFKDVWFFEEDFSIENLLYQKEEVADARWASKEEIMEMFDTGDFVHVLDYLKDLI